MDQAGQSPIVFSEWVPTGIMVHFEGGVSVFFSARFLYDQREVQPNQIFRTEEPSPHEGARADGNGPTPPQDR